LKQAGFVTVNTMGVNSNIYLEKYGKFLVKSLQSNTKYGTVI